MKRIGRYTLQTENNPTIISFASIAGKKESEGPLSHTFDQTISDSYLGQKSFEQAEAHLQNESINIALSKKNLYSDDIDMVFAGDLLNQCISSTFGARDLSIPYIGQFAACSTMAQNIALASIMVDSGSARKAIAVTSSHFCTAERQFRTPLEYGGQRTPTAQWTTTASGCAIIGTGGKLLINRLCFGKIIDLGVTDMANMGAAMAPACADTIFQFLKDTGAQINDYDQIYSGDLGKVGSSLLYDIMLKNGLNISQKHKDCGLLIFDLEKQDAHAGASGPGCSASVLCGHILSDMLDGKMKKILFCATGALMSPTSSLQGESIPSICHLVEIIKI